MLLTITTTHRLAMDLGFLLHKNPAKCQTFELSFGKVHVVYPEAGGLAGKVLIFGWHACRFFAGMCFRVAPWPA
jgi:hypothetical protein